MKTLHKRITHIQGEYVQNFERARTRLFAVLLFFTFAYIIVTARLVMLMSPAILNPNHTPDIQHTHTLGITPKRANILDRNGTLIATSLETPSLYADPKLVEDAQRLSHDLIEIFPDLSYEDIYKDLSKNRRFVWIKRHLTPKQHAAVLKLGDPALNVKTEYRRVYPHNELFAHTLGYTDIDGKGIAGIEKQYNDTLINTDQDIELSLDVRLQDLLRSEIQKSIDKFSAIGGSGIIMNANTGEILSLVSLPDFDPHSPKKANDDQKFNRNTVGVYEMGSTFKIFSIAAGLEFEAIHLKDSYDVRKPMKVARFTIRDFKPKKRDLSLAEVFVYSSNIGTAQIAETLGTEKLKNFYSDLGFFKKLDVDLPERGRPIVPKPWRDINTLTASYGHGLAVTPLHVARATAAIVNGGTLHTPTLKQSPQKSLNLSIISPQTASTMRGLMALTVENGTGSKVKSDHVWVGGKTGTAEKIVDGKYEADKLLSSFVGVFPMDNPEYVILVTIDEPIGIKESYGYATGGWTAAPIVGKIIEAMKPMMKDTQDMQKGPFPALDALRPYIKEDKTHASF